MQLSDAAIRNAKPGIKPDGSTTTKPYKMSDSGGLYLLVTPAGGKLFNVKYRFSGKEKKLALGPYPTITLKEARAKCDEAKRLLEAGIDPGQKKQDDKLLSAEQQSNTLAHITQEWIEAKGNTCTDEYKARTFRMVSRALFKPLGKRPIAEIKAPELLAALRKVESTGTIYTARRVLQLMGEVFRFAIATGRAEYDIAASLKGALKKHETQHFAAVTEPQKVGEILRVIYDYTGQPATIAALKLAPMLFVRPGELREAEWTEFDLATAEWRIPAERMKMREPHIVPLSQQALEILEWLRLLTGQYRYVFPGVRDAGRPMSNNTINGALRRLGITGDELTGHGFRAMARTILDEVLGERPDIVEHQLAHAVKDPNGRAYNRTKFLVERRRMMQRWADYLDQLRTGTEVIPQPSTT
jgi:integrase